MTALGLISLPGCGPPPPDIVLVTLDTLRLDHVGAYGAKTDLTPNLDQLAQSGLVHEAAFTTMPTTGPAHLSLFTGMYPSEIGATRNAELLPERHASRELAGILAADGYATGAFVTSVVLGPDGTGMRGFGTYKQPPAILNPGAKAVRDALTWLDAQSQQRPIFLWVHLYDPHAPYGDPNQKRVSFPLDARVYGWIDPAHFASGEVASQIDKWYRDGVREADTQLGQLLRGVREQRDQPPVVIVAADHGESLTEHLMSRSYTYDHGEFLDPETIRIPLVIAGPGIEPGRSTAAVSIRDLYTTILRAAGVGDPSASEEGRRDLRLASSDPRIVEIERRSFNERQSPLVEGHYGGASDGTRIVVAGPKGQPTSGAEGASKELLEVAGRRANQAAQAARRAPPDFTQATIDALKRLGYAQ